MAFKIGSQPKELRIVLDYPYLEGDEVPVHYFPRISHEQLRSIRKKIFGTNGENRALAEDEGTFEFWSEHVLDKTRESYEGLSEENWKRELWEDEEGRKHIVNAVQGYFNA